MKLRSQLTLAFAILLIVVLTVTSYMIYSLLMNLLVQNEQRQLQETGKVLVSFVTEEYGKFTEPQQFNQFLADQELQLFLYDRKRDAVLFSTMPNTVVAGFMLENSFADIRQDTWRLGSDRFVTSRILFSADQSDIELILLTPMSDLREVEQDFIIRLYFIFFIGALLAIVLSYYLTNRLVTPLSQLKVQLKKIEKRQFDNLERIEATGEIKEVEQSVYDMATELQRYINSQQVFFQNASHELKTPLMAIQGYVEGIKDGVFTGKEQEKGLDTIVEEVHRLKDIINEMILLAKLETTKTIEPTEIDFTRFFDLIKDRHMLLSNEKNVQLEKKVESNLKLIADEERLLRAISNIVVNGVRHAKSKVLIQAYSDNRDVIITVEDDGDGIKTELLPHIFHRFVKGKDGETGLGLAIARAIVEQFDGKIEAANSESIGGARFIITFPNQLDKPLKQSNPLQTLEDH